MTGGTHDVGARLRQLVIAGDLAELRSYLDGLTGADLKAARRWVAGRHDVDVHPYPDELGDRWDDARYTRARAMHLARLVSWGRIGAPVAASKAVATELPFVLHAQMPELIASFVGRDRDWAHAFAVAADSVSPSASGADTVSSLLRAVVEAHQLPVPSGTNFHKSWIRRLAEHASAHEWSANHAPPLDVVRADPLLPDVVYHQLASGEVGRWTGFAQVLPPLVDEGLLNRDRTLTVALDQLTAAQRPTSQRVLAGVLTALELRAEEVPGGLDYLMSVLSSCHGSAAAPVLQLAIDLVASDADAVELARVIAPRSETGLRRTLLAALSPTGLGRCVGPPALLEAIDVLAAGDEDVAARARYDKARAALGAATASEPPVARPVTLGLWDLAVEAPEQRPTLRFPLPLRDKCKELMRTADKSWNEPEATPFLVDAALRGELTTADLLGAAYELVAQGRLSPARSATFFEALFLGGAMRAAWPAALGTAELAASGARPLPGLDRLLAMLTSYAGELPAPVQLPPHLVRVSRGTSKSALEIVRLAGLLGSSTAEMEPGPVHLGLWDEETERPPWALAYPPVRNLGTIGRRLASGVAHVESSTDLRHRVRHVLLLDELAALVAEHGADEVRASLRKWLPVEWGAYGSARAVQLWASGTLTPEAYWRIATTAVLFDAMPPEWREAQEEPYYWSAARGLAQDPPVMPGDWRYDGWALEFLHACEVLLVIERGGHVVSSPDVVDGTLGLVHLLERLARAPRVGPLDLRLALARLRPTTPEQATRIGGSMPTDPALTSAAGDIAANAIEVVREWVAAGGMRVVPGHEPPMRMHPSFVALAPTRWDDLAALAARGPIDDLPTSRTDDVWRLPGQPDAWLRGGLNHDKRASLGDVGGTLGQSGWETILRALGAREPDYLVLDLHSLVRLSRQGRLDPVVARATAISLWDEGAEDLLGDPVGWELAFLRGAMRGTWPVAVAVVEAGLARADRPQGVDELVEVMRRHVHEVPRDAVPSWLAEE